MNLGRKIILSFIFLAILLIGIGIVWEIYYTKISTQQFSESKNATAVVEYSNAMEVSLLQSLLHLNLVHEINELEINNANPGSTPPASRPKLDYDKTIKDFYESCRLLKEALSEKEVLLEQITDLNERVALYENLAEEWLVLLEEKAPDSEFMFVSSIAPYFMNKIMPKFEEIRVLAKQDQEARINALDVELHQGQIINYVATFLTIIIGVIVALYLYRSIASPLTELTQSVQKLGSGDLTERLEIKTDDEFGRVGKAFNEMAENLERQTISSTYLDNVLESIREGIFVSDEDGILRRMNESAAKMLELEKKEIIGKSFSSFFKIVEVESNNLKDRPQEYQLVSSKDNKIPVLLSSSDLFENDQKRGRVLVVSDISELKEAENKVRSSLVEKDVMLAEIHHRVKNNLAVITGLLELQILQNKDDAIKNALLDSQMRIQSIALVHEKLYASDSLAFIDYGNYIEELSNSIKNSYPGIWDKIHVHLKVNDISLNVNQAIPCSLILNEIINNAFKHAFTDKDGGTIEIKAEETDDNITLIISDNGVGFDFDEISTADFLGITLIETLADQLKGNYLFSTNEGGGTMFTLEFKKEV